MEPCRTGDSWPKSIINFPPRRKVGPAGTRRTQVLDSVLGKINPRGRCPLFGWWLSNWKLMQITRHLRPGLVQSNLTPRSSLDEYRKRAISISLMVSWCLKWHPVDGPGRRRCRKKQTATAKCRVYDANFSKSQCLVLLDSPSLSWSPSVFKWNIYESTLEVDVTSHLSTVPHKGPIWPTRADGIIIPSLGDSIITKSKFCAKSIFRPNTHSWRLLLSSDKTNSNLKLIYPAIVNPCALTRKDTLLRIVLDGKTSGSKETQLLSSGWHRTHMRDKLIGFGTSPESVSGKSSTHVFVQVSTFWVKM